LFRCPFFVFSLNSGKIERMKKLLPLSVFTFLLMGAAMAQHPTCDGTRYTELASYTPSSTTGIQFGNATTIGGNNQDLFLDFYEPTGDVATARPLIILAFGGSFISGTRQDMDWMCEYYTSLGYATATIDYRLYDGPFIPLPDSVDMTEEVLMSISDMKAAIRFFKEDAANANTYRIDSNYIFVGGISAGGIAASHTALLDSTDAIEAYIQPLLANNGGWTGNSSTNTQHTDNVRGLLNYSGAMRKASYIDANDPAIFSVHDDGDNVVPYGSGAASIFGVPIITMEGSELMDAQAQSVGVSSELLTFANSNGHVSYFSGSAATTDSILGRSTEFLYNIVCPQFVGLDSQEETFHFEMYPNPTGDELTVSWEDMKVSEIAVMSATGQKMLVHKPTENYHTLLDLSFLASGIYYVRIESDYGTTVRSIQKM